MADFRLDAQISESGTIRCQLSASFEQQIERPKLCLSLLAAGRVVTGGKLLSSLGGFCEIELDGQLSNNRPLKFEIGYRNEEFRAKNRAWLPLSPYLKMDNGDIHQVSWDSRGVVSAQIDLPKANSKLLRLVPQPKSWVPKGEFGAFKGFQIDGPKTAIQSFLAVDDIAKRNSFRQFLSGAGTKVIVEHNPDLQSGGYIIDLANENIKIRAADDKGHFYAAITLLTLLTTYDGYLPLGVIRDQPRFQWRGQHLDCARHYFKPATLLRFLDLLALMKLNVFHWHFADDEAFRLQVDCQPDLWKESAFRGEDQTLPGVFGGGSGPYGGSYGKTAVAEILERAKNLHIDVLPEIEVPAHSLATTKIFPNLRDPADDGTETSVQDYQKNTLNPALPQTWDFLEALSGEVCKIFPFAHIHLGGDELPTGCWNNSPKIWELKNQKRLNTENDILGFTMARLANYVQILGARPCAWEEAAKGNQVGIGHNALLFSWTGQEPGLRAAQNGYDVIMCPAKHLYFDMAHSDEPDDWGATWCGSVTLSDTIDWDPAPAGIGDIRKKIIGVQGAFWSEFTTEDSQMEPMLAPRILGLSSRAWSTQNGISKTTLNELAKAYAPLFNAINWNWNRSAV